MAERKIASTFRQGFTALTVALSLLSFSSVPALADRDVRIAVGDTLSSISLNYYGDLAHVQTIVAYNGLSNPNQIYAGQLLHLPDPSRQLATTVDSSDPWGSLASSVSFAADLIRQSADIALPLSAMPAPAQAFAASEATVAPAQPPAPLAEPTVRAATKPAVAVVAPAAAPIIQTGLATWYGPGFDGQRTKCGQVYQQWGYTAASNDLPCGSVIQVTNLGTGLSVIVTVTDTGAFRHPNILDLSRGAFSAIASTDSGVISVSVALLSR
ncbi:MAG: RlpA-like double-psi beta-barrel domain-containing protein [Dehalococcoidia bacterium]